MNVNVIRGFRYLSKRKDNSSGAWENHEGRENKVPVQL